jgi:uroporphyrinogen decarboxylase
MPQFAPLKNDTFLRALLRQPTEYTPVWLMRQAGRYLPEYRATRARAGSFLGLAKNPDYATEVTLQPLDRYPLDASILFSDILTVPDAMGLGLYFAEGEGPKFERPLRSEAEVMALQVPDMASLDYVFKAVTQIRTEINGRVPLIGFSGSPWTLACYMVEGQGSREFGGPVSERADRRRRPGRHDFRFLGRGAGRWRLPGILAALHAAGAQPAPA